MKRDSIKQAQSTHNQRLLLVQLLRDAHNKTLNTYELRANGVGEPPSRVSELNCRGYVIKVVRNNAIDAHGYMHRNVAYYTLVSEPDAISSVA